MAILGTLLKKGIRIREMLEQEYTSSYDLQKKELKELLITANGTEFGKYYNFSEILNGFRKTIRNSTDASSQKFPFIHTTKCITTGGNLRRRE